MINIITISMITNTDVIISDVLFNILEVIFFILSITIKSYNYSLKSFIILFENIASSISSS